MNRPELGKKYTCVGCAVRFYDLNRPLPICPQCGVQQPPEKPRVVRPTRNTLESRRLARNPDPVPVDEDVVADEVEEHEDDGSEPVDDSDDDVELETGVVKPVD